MVHAKTGTLDQVATLAGYLGRPDGVSSSPLCITAGGPTRHGRPSGGFFRLLGAEGVNLSGALETQMGGSHEPG